MTTATNKPKRSSSHRKEDKSKRAFEEVLDPFFVAGWHQKDYGIDSVVEITTNGDGDVDIESRCFLVQLKATDKIKLSGNNISFSVETKKILYWYNYNLPVCFVLFDCQNAVFYYKWIDEALIAELDGAKPNWGKQKNITLKIKQNQKLDKGSLESIKNHVVRWKAASRRNLLPGTYFELRNRGYELISEYKKITEPFKFVSINEAVKTFEMDIDLSIYRLAITGLSRVGKSSLINALLKMKISPTGFYQTTGVPIQIIPGHENSLNIFFHNNSCETMLLSIDNVEQFASQDNNTDNQKQVKLVSISIKNDLLERGVSLFDIPGLDDPSDDILEYTWQTVKKVNAIIYVIDASPAEDGGYIFKNDYKKHISTFSQSQDKVFLVFNKCDKLSVNTIQGLKERVVKDLAKHGLSEQIGSKIFYLSAEREASNGEMNTVEEVSEALWDFMLKENKYGIVKLNLLNQEVAKNSQTFNSILQARMIDSQKRLELERGIDKVRKKMPSLTDSLVGKKNTSCRLITDYLQNKEHRILNELEVILKKIPKDKPLPSSGAIKKYLADNLNAAIEHANNEYALQVNQTKSFVDEWIEENLTQVREILNAEIDNKVIDFTEIETFEAPQADISSAWGMGVLGVFAGLAFAPIAATAFLGGIIGFFGALFMSSESIRSNQINRIIERSRDRYGIIFPKLKNAYQELMSDQTNSINIYIKRKLNLFFNDLQAQMIKFDKPLTDLELTEAKAILTQINLFQQRLNDFDSELRSYLFTK